MPRIKVRTEVRPTRQLAVAAISNRRQRPSRFLARMHARGTDVTATPTSSLEAKDYFGIDDRPVILFDGVCNMCNGGVNLMLDWDTAGNFRFAALQSAAGKALLQRSGRHPEDISSIVLVDRSTSYLRSEAILRIATKLQLPFAFLATLGLLVPVPFRDFAYDQVAKNRYQFLGQRRECRVSDNRFYERFIIE